MKKTAASAILSPKPVKRSEEYIYEGRIPLAEEILATPCEALWAAFAGKNVFFTD